MSNSLVMECFVAQLVMVLASSLPSIVSTLKEGKYLDQLVKVIFYRL
jgi:hypothetical protein